MKEGLNKERLEKLYIKQGKSTYKIAKMYGCSITLVRYRCIKYGIKLRPRRESIKIKESVFHKLYVKEGKSLDEIAERFSCHLETVRRKCKQYDIAIKNSRKIEGLSKAVLQRLYINEGNPLNTTNTNINPYRPTQKHQRLQTKKSLDI